MKKDSRQDGSLNVVYLVRYSYIHELRIIQSIRMKIVVYKQSRRIHRLCEDICPAYVYHSDQHNNLRLIQRSRDHTVPFAIDLDQCVIVSMAASVAWHIWICRSHSKVVLRHHLC